MMDLLETLRDNGVGDLLPRDLEQQLQALGIHDVTSTTNGDVTVVRATVVGASVPAGNAPSSRSTPAVESLSSRNWPTRSASGS